MRLSLTEEQRKEEILQIEKEEILLTLRTIARAVRQIKHEPTRKESLYMLGSIGIEKINNKLTEGEVLSIFRGGEF